MSKKNQLVLAAFPFASLSYTDCFTNLKKEELDAIKQPWEDFLEAVFDLINHEDEDKANSTAHIYDAFRSRFPIGSREGEIVLLQLCGAFARDVEAKLEAIMQRNPLQMLEDILGGLGDKEEAEDQDAAVVGRD